MSEEIKISRKDIIGLCEFLKIHHFENAYTLFEYTEGLEQKVEQLENIRKEANDFIKNNTYEYFHDGNFREKGFCIHRTKFINTLLNILNKGSE